MTSAASIDGQLLNRGQLSHIGRNVLPNTLEGFRDYHKDETIIVCGCGHSLGSFSDYNQCITIGVNDVGRFFDPTYLVVLNDRTQFYGDRFFYVARSRAQALFSQMDLGVSHPHVVRFNLGQFGGVTWDVANTLPYTCNSPYVALCIAGLMGAKRIGLIGVDFTEHHFFARTGWHMLAGQFPAIDQEYRKLADALQACGVRVVNLSKESRLTAFSKGDIADLGLPDPSLASQSNGAPMNAGWGP
jgi:hypothetical protein